MSVGKGGALFALATTIVLGAVKLLSEKAGLIVPEEVVELLTLSVYGGLAAAAWGIRRALEERK